jgi:1-hydroxy-2-isopentenylcarotenoid 3,4-desaturase
VTVAPPELPRVVVVGGGIGGLATAALLARGGAQVTLLERHERVGGRAGTLDLDGFRFDTGPSWYFMPEVFEHWFALLGERVEDHLDLVPLDPSYRVFFEGSRGEQPSAGASSAVRPDGAACRAQASTGLAGTVLDVTRDAHANWARFDALSPGDGERMRAYAAASSEAYRLALDHFLYTTFERPDRAVDVSVLRRLPRLATLLSRSLADRVARRVHDPRLRQVLGYHAVFLGSSPYRVPALYSLMSHLDLVEGVRFPRGGMYTIVQAMEKLARSEGVTIRTGSDVVGIEVDPLPDGAASPRARTGRSRRGATGVATGVRLSGGEVVPADIVVSGADLHHTQTALVPPEWADLPAGSWQDKGPGISALLILAGVRGGLPELAHHSLFFTEDWRGNFADVLGEAAHSPVDSLRVPVPASLYVSRTSATEDATVDQPAAPPGHENLFVLVPFPADPALGGSAASQADLERLADGYLDQIGAWAGIEGLRERVVTRRVLGPAHFAVEFSSWRGTALGMEHTLAQSAMFRPPGASRKVANLYYAGAGTAPGVGLPMCLISAELVAKRLLGETSARPLPTPLRPGYLAASRRPERLRGAS